MQNLPALLSQILTTDDIENVPQTALDNNVVSNAMQMVFGIFAAAAVLIIAISALRIIISRGNPQDVSKARDAIIYASVGLVISLSALAIVTFVVERV